MNDVLETEIREMLRAKASSAFEAEPLAPPPLGRARARRASNGIAVLAGVAVLAVAATTVVGRFTSEPIHPIGPVPKVSATYSIPGEPTDVTFGFGSVWVATEDAILRIDPSSGQVKARFADFPEETTPRAPGPSVNRIVVGSDAVYTIVMDDGYRTSVNPTATSRASNNNIASTGASISVTPPPEGFIPKWAVVRIDPSSNELRNSGLFSQTLPISIAIDGQGAWVTGWRTDARPDKGFLARITFGSSAIGIKMFDLPKGEPAGVAADDTGVWVALRTEDAIVRLDRADARELARAQVADPVNLVLNDGEIFVSSVGPDMWGFGRMDKASLEKRETTMAGIHGDMVAEMIGAKDYVWVLLKANNDLLKGGLYWIDRISGRVVDQIDVPVFSRELVPGDGALWMVGGSTGDAKLYRVALPEELG